MSNIPSLFKLYPRSVTPLPVKLNLTNNPAEYHLLCDAKNPPSHCQHLRVRLKTEQHRLLNWADVVQLDLDDKALYVGRSTKGEVMDVLERIQGLLNWFGREDGGGHGGSWCVLVEDVGDNVGKLQNFTEASVPTENPQRPKRAGFDAQVELPGSETVLLQQCRAYIRAQTQQFTQLRWLACDETVFSTLITKLSCLNDSMRDMLDSTQIFALETKQAHTQSRMMQLDNLIQKIVRLFQMHGLEMSKEEGGIDGLTRAVANSLSLERRISLAQLSPCPRFVVALDEEGDTILSKNGSSKPGDQPNTRKPGPSATSVQGVLSPWYNSPEIQILDTTPYKNINPTFRSSTHMLPEKSDTISLQTWPFLIQLLPQTSPPRPHIHRTK